MTPLPKIAGVKALRDQRDWVLGREGGARKNTDLLTEALLMTGLSDGRGFGYQPQRTPILCVRARGPTYSNGAVDECVCACAVCLIPIQHNAGPSDNTNSPGGLRTGGPQLGPRGSSSSRRRQGWRSESTRQGRLRGRRAVARCARLQRTWAAGEGS